jgi:hypothetical protein
MDFRAELDATLLTEKETFQKVMTEMGEYKPTPKKQPMMGLETMLEKQ